ncbi:MAG TPA: TolC family protein [Limnobacter sp.]|nr:TolC family protein [Limnobacter sp.]
MRWFVCFAALGGLHTQVAAVSLQDLYAKAQASEPSYQSAIANLQAAAAKRQQAFGGLLPQVSINASTNENARDYKTRNSLIPPASDEYGSESATINFTQAVFRPANLFAFKQSNNVLLQAEQELRAAEQGLILNLSVAWFEWLAAMDARWLADRKLAFASRELALTDRGHALGVYSQVELELALAKQELASAELESAQVEVEVKKAEIERLAGEFEVPAVPSLNKNVADPVQPGQTMEQVVADIQLNNPQFLAAQQALYAAAQEIRKQRAGHAPTLDWVISHGKNSQGVGGFPGQFGYDITTTSSGLQLNVPLYSGGAVQGKVNEAMAQRNKASADLTGALRQARFGIKQAWFALISARAKSKAARQNRLAASTAYLQAKRSAELGVDSELAVLKAEQDMVSAENDYNKSKYDQWSAWIRLKAGAGMLGQADIDMLQRLMVYPKGPHQP